MCFRNGMVEFLLFPKIDKKLTFPNGRIDFLPEKLGAPYDRENTNNIPFFTSKEELKAILERLFPFFEDIKEGIFKQLNLLRQCFYNSTQPLFFKYDLDQNKLCTII